MQENFAMLNQGAALERPTFVIKFLRFWVPGLCHTAILDCREIHRIARASWATFLNDHLFMKDHRPESSTTQRIWHFHLKIWDLIFQRQQRERNEKGNHWIRRLNHLTSKIEVDCWIRLVELILTVVWWFIRELPSRIGILGNFLTLWNPKAGRSTSELKVVYEQPILGSRCSGSKKLRMLKQVTNLWHRDRLRDSLNFLVSICLMRWLRQPRTRFSTRSQISGKEYVSKSNELRYPTDSYEEDKLLTWFMGTSVQPERMKQ